MSATIQKESGGLWQFRVSGVLKKAELDAAQAFARQEIARGGKIRLLLVLDGFKGWEKGADWGDLTFTSTHRNQIARLAIVGDPRWETPALMFVGAGFRRTQVRFFVPGDLFRARAWLALDSVVPAVGPRAAAIETTSGGSDSPEGERPDPWVSRLRQDAPGSPAGDSTAGEVPSVVRRFRRPKSKT